MAAGPFWEDFLPKPCTLKTEYRTQKRSKTKNERHRFKTGRDQEGSVFIARYRSLWTSYEGRRADALALRADERRDKLRKAAGSGIYTVSRRFLNGATHMSKPHVPLTESIG